MTHLQAIRVTPIGIPYGDALLTEFAGALFRVSTPIHHRSKRRSKRHG